jgi:hypothetical protein
MYGEDADYADSRLAGTIVRLLNGEPVFVHHVRGGMDALVSTLADLYTPFNVHAGELNLVPVALGMCNFNEGAHYLSRIPLRRDWKQGLRKENFTCDTVHVQLIPPTTLRQVILGEYPTLDECIKLCAEKKVGSVAWHRHWAITSKGILRYKNEGPVGIVRDGALALNEPYRYLQEALGEVA